MAKNYDIPEILIIVEGGLIQDVEIPKDCNIKVKVKDYDVSDYATVEELNEMPEDEEGRKYFEGIWEN